MTGYDVKRFALTLAVQAEIEGMKVTNLERQDQAQGLAYDEREFVNAADELRAIAAMHDDQL